MLLLSHSRTLVWHTESCRQQTVNRLSSCNISCSAPCRHRLRRLPSYLPPLAAHFAALLAEQSSVALQERRSCSRSRRRRVVCCCIAYVASACSAVLHATVAFTVSCLIRLIKCANLLSSVQYSTVLRPHCLCASSHPLPPCLVASKCGLQTSLRQRVFRFFCFLFVSASSSSLRQFGKLRRVYALRNWKKISFR